MLPEPDGLCFVASAAAPEDETPPIDPLRLRRAWRRAAPAFSDPELAVEVGFLNHVAAELVARSAEIRHTPERILDLGCRTGETARLLRKRWPEARVVSLALAERPRSGGLAARIFGRRDAGMLVADPAALPLRSDGFDLVVSSMMLHWCPLPRAALREMRRVLAPGRPLLLSTVGADTLQELRGCLETLDQDRYGRIWPRVLALPTLHQFGDHLRAGGLAQPVVDRTLLRATFPDPLTLVRRLRRLGVGNHHRSRAPGLAGRAWPDRLARLYRQRHGPERGEIAVTVELFFGHAWKGGGAPAARGNGNGNGISTG